MGNTSNPQTKDHINSQKSTQTERQAIIIKHPKLLAGVLVQNRNQKNWEISMPIYNTQQFEDWTNVLQYSPIYSSNFAFRPLKYSFHSNGICGNGGTAKISYEFYPFLLTEQIHERSKYVEKSYFQQPELWYLLYGLCDLACTFHLKNQKVGDIRPINVLLNQNGAFKIINNHSWPGQMNSYHKFLHEKEKTFLSPAEIQDVQLKKKASIGDFITAQSFSIGLTCLCAALLEDGEKLYQKEQFKYQLFQSFKVCLQKYKDYSDLLKSVIMSLVDFSSQNRVTSEELKNWMLPVEQKILSMKYFEMNNFPKNVCLAGQKMGFYLRNDDKDSETKNRGIIRQVCRLTGIL